MKSDSISKVLVTGASGFIGLHTVLCCLQRSYRVRATVRSNANEGHVREVLQEHVDISRLEFVHADLLKDEGWDAAVKGCDSVIHTASPYKAENPKDESVLIAPALDGTMRVLHAAMKEGIHRVVYLSTIGAIFDGHEGENRVFTEQDWSDVDHPRLIYHKGKTLAEKAAWDLINSDQNQRKMELVAVNPTNVMGPVLDGHLHTSTEWYLTLMRGEVPGISRSQLDLVDVRDLTDILIRAMTEPQAAGKRFICNGASIPLIEFAQILYDHFSERGYKIPHKLIPSFVIRLLGLFDPKVKAVADSIDWEYRLCTDQIKEVFNWQPRPYQQTIVEMAESLIKFGMV
jgi:dihydroflavonol-4-reductase